MTRRRGIIHVGAPRTGTTTLQTLLHRHRASLMAAGVLYPALAPASSEGSHINHQDLGETFDGRRPRAERIELLDALDRQLAAATADVLVLSYERLSLLPAWRGAAPALRAVLARHGFAMELLVTVRAQAGAAQSRYTWRCQFMREAKSFSEAFERDIRDPRLHPATGLAPWLRAADGRATAVPLRDARSSEPLASRVAAALGLADRIGPLLSRMDLAEAENRSLGAVAVEACRRLRAEGARLRDKSAARRVVDFIDAELRRRGTSTERFQGLDTDMLARAEDRFARANERFARRMWGEPWSSRVAPDVVGPVTELARQSGPPSVAVEAALVEVCAAARAAFAFDQPRWTAMVHRLACLMSR